MICPAPSEHGKRSVHTRVARALTVPGAASQVLPMQHPPASNGSDRSPLRTPICDLFGIEYPICLAGMGGVSMAPLVAAVSNAGGLGVMGAANLVARRPARGDPQDAALTEQPFAVDLLAPIPEMIEPYLPVLFDEEVKIFVAGLAVPEKHVGEMKRHGMKIMVMTGKVQHAMPCRGGGRRRRRGAGHGGGRPHRRDRHAGARAAGGRRGEDPGRRRRRHRRRPRRRRRAGARRAGRDHRHALHRHARGARPRAQYREALVRAKQDETIRTRCYSGKPLRVAAQPRTSPSTRPTPATIKRFPEQLMISSQRKVMAYWNAGGAIRSAPACRRGRASAASTRSSRRATCCARSSRRPRRSSAAASSRPRR